MATATAANRGARWDADQDTWLWLKAPLMPMAKLASTMERTPWAIRMRLLRLACEHVQAGDATLESAAVHIGMTVGDLHEYEAQIADKAAAAASFYAIVGGAIPAAIVRSWAECQRHMTQAKGPGGAKAAYKKCGTEVEAQAFIDAGAGGTSSSLVPTVPVAEPDSHKIILTESQLVAMEAIKTGASLCITGAAGTGKSTLLNQVRLWAHNADMEYGVTAMTGCAALLIGGRTVHSFLGVGLAKGTPEELAASVKKLKGLVVKLCKLELLFIDEISMCSAEFLDKISRYLQIVRRNDAPFGGVQMVFMGDFMQLPPVIKGGAGATAVFAFESAEWRRLAPRVIVLTQVMRQANDLEFATMLERLRWGNCLPEDLEALTSCKDRDFGDVRPTILFSINRDVERVNTNSFMALLKNTGNPPIALKTEYGGNKEVAQRWARSCEIPDEVVVAVGAQVVVTANMDIDSGIVNGTRAIVHAWNEGTKICTLRLVNGRLYKVGLWKPTTDMFGDVPKVLWYPIKLAYALSVHKAQGMTLDAAELDLGSSIFEFGQAYTALSRVRSLQDVCILDVSAASFKSHPKVKAFYASAT